jgi:hypothetical protein
MPKLTKEQQNKIILCWNNILFADMFELLESWGYGGTILSQFQQEYIAN